MTQETKAFDDFYAGRMSPEEEEEFIDKYGAQIKDFEINKTFEEIYGSND